MPATELKVRERLLAPSPPSGGEQPCQALLLANSLAPREGGEGGGEG